MLKIAKKCNDETEESYRHITIDLNRPIGRDGLPALATAVSLRLYRIYLPLLDAGASPDFALLEAIKNSDHLSIAILLNISHPSLFSSPPSNGIPLEISLACSSPLLLPSVIPQLYEKYRSLYSIDSDSLHVDLLCPTPVRQTLNSLSSSSSSSLPSSTFLSTALSYDSTLNESIPLCHIDVIRITPTGDTPSGSSSGDDHEIAVTLKEFLVKYVHKKRPVVIRGLINEDSLSHWSYSNLMRLGERLQVTPKSIPYEDQLTSERRKVLKEIPLADYLSEMRNYTTSVQQWIHQQQQLHNSSDVDLYHLSRYGGIGKGGEGEEKKEMEGYPYPTPRYIFDNQILSLNDPVSTLLISPFPESTNLRPAPTPSSLLFDEIIQSTFDSLHNSTSATPTGDASSKPYSVTRQFYLGPPLSGAPFHAHGPAFNALLYGRKLWFLLPPGSDLYSNIPPVTWAKRMEAPLPEREKFFPYPLSGELNDSELSQLSYPPQLCHYTQHPQDILFVPSLYSHQVLNLDETVGFATEIHFQGRGS